MSNIAYIPIRSGSKSIPNKNISLFCDKPLAYWSIQAALNCKDIDKVYIDTDSLYYVQIFEDIFKDNPKFNYFIRTNEFANDTTSTEDSLLNFINKNKDTLEDNDNITLIQATNPFLKCGYISQALSILSQNKICDSVISGTITSRFFWKYTKETNKFIPINYDYKNRKRRQDIQEINFIENG